jgi:hypothetical protein
LILLAISSSVPPFPDTTLPRYTRTPVLQVLFHPLYIQYSS